MIRASEIHEPHAGGGRRPAPRVTTAAALAALLALSCGACGKKAPAVVTPPAPAPSQAPTITPKKEPPPPPLTPAQKAQIEIDFRAAKQLVAEARAIKAKGDLIQREQGVEAANDTYVEARKLFRKAVQDTGKWAEPEMGEVSQKQVDQDATLRSFLSEREGWIKDISAMGKLHVR